MWKIAILMHMLLATVLAGVAIVVIVAIEAHYDDIQPRGDSP